jgi:hypothetical protein
LVVITVDDADPDAELAGAAADGEELLLPLLLLHAAAASSATASGAASLTGTGTRASNEALIVIIPLVRRWAVCAAAQFGCYGSVVICELCTAGNGATAWIVLRDLHHIRRLCARHGNFSVVFPLTSAGRAGAEGGEGVGDHQLADGEPVDGGRAPAARGRAGDVRGRLDDSAPGEDALQVGG